MIESKSVTIEEIVVSKDILELPYKEKLKLINQFFKNEWQGKTVTYQFFEENKLVKINKNTRQHITHKDKFSKDKEHRAKINILAGGKGENLWNGAQYDSYKEEIKPNQNTIHSKTFQWHYFVKDILFNGCVYQVLVNVRESTIDEYYIHSISLKQKRNASSNSLFSK